MPEHKSNYTKYSMCMNITNKVTEKYKIKYVLCYTKFTLIAGWRLSSNQHCMKKWGPLI